MNFSFPKKTFTIFCNFDGDYVFFFLDFMVEALGKASESRDKLYYCCLPKNSEVYRSLDISKYRFLDSLAFLPHTLDELVKDFKARVHVNDMK